MDSSPLPPPDIQLESEPVVIVAAPTDPVTPPAVVVSELEVSTGSRSVLAPKIAEAQLVSTAGLGTKTEVQFASSLGLGPLRSMDTTSRSVLSGESSEQQELFKQIQEDYENTMKELGDSADLQKFKSEYARVFQTFTQVRENESKLGKRCQELQNEISNQSNQMQTSVKLNQNDRATIINLKKDIKKSWEMVEEAKDREEKTKETISQLKSEVGILQATLQQTARAGLDHEQTLNELVRQKDDLMKERDMQINQILQLRSELGDMAENIKALEVYKIKTDHEISSLKEEILNRKGDIEKEVRNKERLEKELKEARSVIEQKNADIRNKFDSIGRMKDEVSKMENQLREQKLLIDKTTKEYDQLQIKAAKLQQDYDEQIMATTHLISQNQAKGQELKNREEEIFRVKEEIKSVGRVRDSLQKRLKNAEDQKNAVETEKGELKSINHSLEKDVETCKRQIDQEKRQIEELTREKEILTKNLQKSLNSTQKQQVLLSMQEQAKQSLEQDIAMFKEEASKQRKLIYSLEKERDKYVTDASQIQNELLQNVEELKVREGEIFEYKKKIAEVETKLKQQQNLYEAVRTDRNVYSKNLVEAQDEINDMKQKLKVTTHQIEQLKDEIHSKEASLAKEHHDHVKIEKERDHLKLELQKLQQQMHVAQENFQNQQVEEQKLRAILAEAETELERRKKEYELVVQERDILGSQVVRRNDETALLYEKIKIQQSILNKGEIQYRERVDDARVLKLEIQRLNQEKVALQKDSLEVTNLNHEIVKLEKNLFREKSRVKILEDQLRNPINIHRWRKLEGSDPEMFELIQKVQNLQKRLIVKTEEVVEKELLIQQREALYEDLKVQLAKQPTQDVYEQVSTCQKSIREKTDKLKAMSSELKLYHGQVSEYRGEIERLNRELSGMKKDFFEQKKKHIKTRHVTKGSDLARIFPSKKEQLGYNALDLALETKDVKLPPIAPAVEPISELPATVEI